MIKSIKQCLNSWNWRGLTLLGKVQVIKAFAVPKILYRTAVLPCEGEFMKEINNLIFGFLWKGKDKVKQTAMINDTENGGLKMVDIDLMIRTQKIMCVKRYLDNNPLGWKKILDYYLEKVGGRFLFHCNFEYVYLPLNLPIFYKQRVCAWSDLKGNAPTTTQEIAHQILWNKRFIRIEKRSIYRSNILKAGFLTVADLYDKHGNPKTAKYSCISRISPVENYFIMCLFNAVPQEWRKELEKSFRKDLPALKFDQNYFYLEIEKEKVDISKVKSRYIYKTFLSKKATKPTAVSRYEKLYNTETFKLDWKIFF